MTSSCSWIRRAQKFYTSTTEEVPPSFPSASGSDSAGLFSWPAAAILRACCRARASALLRRPTAATTAHSIVGPTKTRIFRPASASVTRPALSFSPMATMASAVSTLSGRSLADGRVSSARTCSHVAYTIPPEGWSRQKPWLPTSIRRPLHSPAREGSLLLSSSRSALNVRSLLFSSRRPPSKTSTGASSTLVAPSRGESVLDKKEESVTPVASLSGEG
mmetsp:Transcript_2285/g.4778  ORF Transcript_2285/g.4778 Transcript_2285/m.4778 type:complete len:219 (-) Transcript_2285:381-1037(-)